MFNLLVSADEQAWEGQAKSFDLTRCVREYTDPDINLRFGNFDENSVLELTRMPAIFAYEKDVGKNPKFGRLTAISKRSNRLEVRIDYELINLPRFLSNDELWSMSAELDLGSWESNRTHWAVKNVDLVRELLPKGFILPAQFLLPRPQVRSLAAIDITSHQFEVAFSFPGEYRETVEAVAKEAAALLPAHACFYDNNYQAQLARPSLDLLLQEIYGMRSKLLVVFIGADYERKMWPNIEWKAIRSVLHTKAAARIMYVRMDSGAVGGVFPLDGYIDAGRFSPAQIAGFIAERVALTPPL